MSPILGFTRMRRHQFGKQSVLNTGVAATRRLGVRGVPDIDPNWTDPDVDTGSIDPTLDPYRTHTDITESLSHDPLYFNDLPLIMGAGVIGGVSGSAVGGGAFTWTHAASSLTATTLDYFTDEFADDANNNDSGPPEDGMQLVGGIVERIEVGFDESLGPWTASVDWRFSKVAAHVTPTSGLLVASNSVIAFGADTQLFIDDTSGGIGGTSIDDAMHSASIVIENSIDVKRFANGSNTRFQVDGYGLSARAITATFRFAKTSDIVAALNSETVDWLNADPVNRYVRLTTTSTAEAESGTAYSWQQSFSGTWRIRNDVEIGGNTVVELVMTGRYDSALGYPYQSVVTNTLAALP